MRITTKQASIIVELFCAGSSIDVLASTWNISPKQVESLVRGALNKPEEVTPCAPPS